MLKQLDTLIGLSVVMLVVSLFITIITQIISSLLGLRGLNLADALEAMVYKIDPDIDGQGKGLAQKLADRVLTHPAISDSVLSMSKAWPLAWKRASAIRPVELLDILKQIAGNTVVPTGNPATVEEAAARLLEALKKPRGANASDAAAITAAIEEMRKQLPALVVQKGMDAIKEFETATNVALSNLEEGFNSSLDRAKQWFAMHARIVTVITAVIAAFGLQLDFLKLFENVSSNADLRAQLVASTPGLLKQTQDVFAAANNTTTNASLSSEVDRKNVADLVQQYGSINNEFSKTGVSLIADPYPSGLAWFWPFPHLLGLLLSAAFLSLGAPFWFNTLKSLTNLRPLLAQQVDNQPGSGPSPDSQS